MKFKTPQLKVQYKHTPAILKLIFQFFETRSVNLFGIEPVITRLTDPFNGESGVHPANRAIDVRSEYRFHDINIKTYKEQQVQILLSLVNYRFYRTDGKKTIIHHSFNGGPHHFHIQVPYLSTQLFLR